MASLTSSLKFAARFTSRPSSQLWRAFRFAGTSAADELGVKINEKLGQKVVIEPFAPQHRKDAMRLLLHSFKNDEPMNGALDRPLADSQVESIFDRAFIVPGLNDGASFVAIEKSTGRMVGVYVSSVHRRDHSESDFDLVDETNPTVVILDFLDIVGSGIWDLLPSDVNVYLKHEVASVLEEYRSVRLGGTLKEMSIEAGKRGGCQYAVTIATAVQSQKMNDRLGFKTLRFVNYADYRVLGKPAFPNMKPPHVRAQLMAKRLI